MTTLENTYDIVITKVRLDDFPFLIENGAIVREFTLFERCLGIMFDVREDKSIMTALALREIEFQELFAFVHIHSGRLWDNGFRHGAGFNGATDTPLTMGHVTRDMPSLGWCIIKSNEWVKIVR